MTNRDRYICYCYQREINTREHFSVYGLYKRPFSILSRWFTGECGITTFEFEELLATKVRALYQRRKGRDLFDLWIGLKEGKANAAKVVEIFREYMKAEGHGISAGDYEKNLEAKMKHVDFVEDITPLLPADINYDIKDAFSLIIQFFEVDLFICWAFRKYRLILRRLFRHWRHPPIFN